MNRGSFIASSASLAALATASGTAAAQSVPGGSHFVERASDFDMAAFHSLVGKPADVRIVIEAVSWHAALLNNVKNLLNGLQFGYGVSPARMAVAIAPHGAASALTYGDYVWSKYKIGDYFKYQTAAGAPITSNAFLTPAKALGPSTDPDDENGMYQDTSIQTLMKRGVIFLTCHTAVEEQSRGLVKAGNAPAGMTPSQVADDILTHLIPGTHVVPSMVATIAVLQQHFHYGYMTIDFT